MSVQTIDDRLRINAETQVQTILYQFAEQELELKNDTLKSLGGGINITQQELRNMARLPRGPSLDHLTDPSREAAHAHLDQMIDSAHSALSLEFMDKVKEISERQDEMASEIEELQG